ncbi:MAG TPA: hypothetical protein VFI88_04515 [Sphingomicrobium sp.]|jgi:uncharacterized membrane protein|nr:hypothetical protein [Sphingomicrobium sp.]
MTSRNTYGGGCFLTAAILIGFLVGLATGNGFRGVLFGTLAGIFVAIVVWLIDRRRR